MMTLRYHVISLTAVFLALALGVVLGSTSVSQRLLSLVAGDRSSLTHQVDQLTAQRDQLLGTQRAADLFASTVAPTVVKGQLSGRKVVLVGAPGAAPADQDALRRLLTEAGASIVGELQLTDAAVDPARADAVRDLTTRLLPAGAQLPSATDPGGLLGGLLAAVLLSRDGQPQVPANQVAAVLTGLAQAGFVRPGSAPPAPGQLAVLLVGGAQSGGYAAEQAATLARMASELDRLGGGAVLAGRSGSAEATGAVGVARADTTVSATLSTVDDVGNPAGQVASVLALRDRTSGRTGRYGTSANAEGPIPAGSAG